MDKPVRITKKNIYAFLRRSAKEISARDLKILPHRGINIVFYYRQDSVLKVAKSRSARVKHLKEAKLLEYLNKCDLPVDIPKLVLAHPEGHYLVQSRIDGLALTRDALLGLSSDEKKAFAQCIGGFLSFLHSHEFPEDVLAHIPRARETLAVLLQRAKRKIEYIKEHAVEFDVAGAEETLNNSRDSLVDIWKPTHGDFSLEHVFAVRGGAGKFAVIDFNYAQLFDASVDLSELLQGQPASLQKMLLEHYSTDDASLEKKVEFRLFCGEIDDLYRSVKTARK